MSLFDMSYYAMIIALLLLSCVFLALPLPKGKGMANFSFSLKFLSLSYALLGTFCIIKHNIPIDIIGLPFFFNASMQAHLLGNSHINMMNPKAVTLKRFTILFLPGLFLIATNLVLVYFYGYHRLTNYDDFAQYAFSFEKPDIFVRELEFIYYAAICIHYITCFYREAVRAKNRIDDFSSEAHYQGLRYIHASFAAVIGVVVFSICQTFCYSEEWCAISNFAILSSYVCLGLFYVQYPKSYYLLQKSGINVEDDEETTGQQDSTNNEQEFWPQWKNKIISEELYTQVGITIVQLAQHLNTNRTTLSTAINRNEDANFNTFINRLRINKAKELMTQQSNLTLTDICLQVGYTDPSNFSRSFKSITGCTPLIWRKNCNC